MLIKIFYTQAFSQGRQRRIARWGVYRLRRNFALANWALRASYGIIKDSSYNIHRCMGNSPWENLRTIVQRVHSSCVYIFWKPSRDEKNLLLIKFLYKIYVYCTIFSPAKISKISSEIRRPIVSRATKKSKNKKRRRNCIRTRHRKSFYNEHSLISISPLGHLSYSLSFHNSKP